MSDKALKLAKSSYYINPEMIRFLVIENLTLKVLLAEKGIFTPEEFKKAHESAAETVNAKVDAQLQEWMKVNSDMVAEIEMAMAKTHPDAADVSA